MIQLDVLVVTEKQRGQGIGSMAMSRICNYADIVGEHIILSATLPVRDVPHSEEAEERLVNWYKRFGFVNSNVPKINYAPMNIPCTRNIMERAPKLFANLDIVVTNL